MAAATSEEPCEQIGASSRSIRELRILLAEDNEINQLLALRLLERQGHSVRIVGNGREALDAIAVERFDVVLMDVQMPKMGGFEATKVIRAQEEKDGSRLPIIAMTANAMKGDRERCLDAGMNGYVSKPVEPGKLYEEIERVMPISAEPKWQGDGPYSSEGTARVFDLVAALAHVSGDRELLVEVTGMFLADCPRLMSNIKGAIACGDAEALGFALHTLKGVVGNFQAQAVSEAAETLEIMAEKSGLSCLKSQLTALDVEIEVLTRALKVYQDGNMVCVS